MGVWGGAGVSERAIVHVVVGGAGGLLVCLKHMHAYYGLGNLDYKSQLWGATNLAFLPSCQRHPTQSQDS